MRRSLLLVSLLFALSAAKSYRYPEIRTEVRLQPDGDAAVRQTRTYRFDGDFSWAFVDLDKTGAGGIEFGRLAESTDAGWRSIEPLELSDSRKSLYVKWGYRASDEQKAFRLEYLVKGAVRRYEDVADFHWKLVEDEHEPVERVYSVVFLPGSSDELFKAYVHSRAAPGRIRFGSDNSRVEIWQERLPRNAFQEVRVLARPELFPQATVIGNRAYERILVEEKRGFIASALKLYLLVPLAVLLIVVVPLILVIVFYARFGREPRLEYHAVYEHEPPRDAPPVYLPGIMHQKLDRKARPREVFKGVFASLLGLAGKGVVSVRELGKDHKGSYEFGLDSLDRTKELEPHDRELVEFLFNTVARGKGSFTDHEFREYGQGHASAVRSKLSSWFDDGRRWWERALGGPLLDQRSSKAYKLMTLLLFASIGIGAVCGVYGLRQVTGPGPLPVILSVSAGVVALALFSAFGRSVLRWNEAAFLEHSRWKRFRKFLREFSAIEEAPVKLLAIWEHYYVYAVALGVAEEFLKNVGRLAEVRGQAVVWPAWYVAAGAAGRGAGFASVQQGIQSLSSLGSNFTGMVASFSPKSSTGGGFSGGGGSGGGGGSSGAG
ncbi:MAG: DUF2207 domain-containing protein [candidate division WOR-3 bacterium]|nr:MAG: DUF2207 domain-containing protein [candidate division WOR-3 bacterium]